MLRLFVGLSLPPEHRLALEPLCQGLHGVRWVDAGNFHVTLRFIGEVDEGVAEDIDQALAHIRAKAFRLSIAGIGIFGPAEKPRLVYAGVDRAPALMDLQARIDGVLARLGHPGEGKRYVPHVTLGYCHAPNPAEIQGYIARHNLMRLEPFEVDGFQLICSYLTKSGSIYEDVAEYPLRWTL